MSDDLRVSAPSPEAVPAGSPGRGAWQSRTGFILAAVGSAVGLGNMWRFPYMTADNGGAAFVLLYIAFTFLVGIPVMISEFAVGRRSQLSPIGALRAQGGRAWVPLGYLFVAAGLLILSYYSVIAGWAIRYSLAAIFSGLPADAAGYFGDVSTGTGAVVFHLIFMAFTIAIVSGGIEKGIERASTLMMPALFAIVVGLAIWAFTLPGSGAGYAFYLQPRMEEIFDLQVVGEAAGQAFFSLSLGMGAMMTFASYLSKQNNLSQEATTIAFSDFGVAFFAGLMIFPIVAALGLQDQISESSVGALFISIPAGFNELGAIGRVVGIAFFLALVLGALTSAISLLEVVTSSVIDEWKVPRRKAAIGMGALIAFIGLWPAGNLDALGFLDALAGNFVLPLGALGLCIIVGWIMKDPIDEVARATPERFRPLLRGWLWTIRIIVPPVLLLVLYYMGVALISAFQALMG